MKRILVVFHLHYLEQLDYFLAKLGNVCDCEADLLVTCVRADGKLKKRFEGFGGRLSFLELPDAGYDIWPFIAAIRTVSADYYDYVIKLHTKRIDNVHTRLNGIGLDGSEWRDCMVDALLGSKDIFRTNLARFEEDTKLGLLCSDVVWMKMNHYVPEELGMLDEETARLGISGHGEKYCCGTIFMARMGAFDLLRTDVVNKSMFDGEMRSDSSSSMSHVYERIFSFLVISSGLKAGTVSTDSLRSLKIKLHNVLSPLLGFIFSINRRGERKYLVIFGLKTNL